MRKINVIIAMLLLFTFASSTRAELQIEITIGSDFLYRSGGTIEIPVYLSNYSETVAGFQFWIQLNRPDIALFQMSVSTSGSVISSWPSPNLTSLSGQNTDILITWYSTSPTWDDALLPQVVGKLFNLILEPKVAPDFPPSSELELLMQISTLDHFTLSTPEGTSIGIITLENIDTSYFDCTEWDGATCLNWEQVVGPTADSMAIDTSLYATLDTNAVQITNGLITTTCCNLPGDFNYDDALNIADLTRMIEFMFNGDVPPPCQSAVDINSSCSIDIVDLTYRVNYMFKGGPVPVCGCID